VYFADFIDKLVACISG